MILMQQLPKFFFILFEIDSLDNFDGLRQILWVFIEAASFALSVLFFYKIKISSGSTHLTVFFHLFIKVSFLFFGRGDAVFICRQPIKRW